MGSWQLYYENYRIVHDNGLYRIAGTTYGAFFTIDDAKARIEKIKKEEAKAIIDEITKNDENQSS